MRRLRRFAIADKSDLIFAKIETGHYLSHPDRQELFRYAVMELGSNILKHADSSGELWLLERRNELCLVACDRGRGIVNTDLAVQRGFSTFVESSLGIGLSSLNGVEGYALSIATSTDPKMHGTIVFFGPDSPLDPVEWLSLPFDENHNGDFMFLKRGLFLFGDVAGHGRKAAETAKVIEEHFIRHCHSVLVAEEYLHQLHQFLMAGEYRSCDVLVGAADPHYAAVCGVGNLTLWEHRNGFIVPYPLRPGSVGAHFGKTTAFEFALRQDHPVWLTTDGVLKERFETFNATIQYHEPIAGICAALFFCASLSDDASILLITPKETL